MKTLESRGLGKFAWGLLVLMGLLGAPAFASDTNDTPAHAQASVATNAPATPSPGVAELLKMADAGVSGEVLKAYVENSTVAWKLTHDDLIALKNHKVPDEVVILMLNRGGESRLAQARARNEAAARIAFSRNQAGGGFDPESYDYFRYHYLQPRAEASVHQRLSPYYFPYGVRAYGAPRYYVGPYRGRGYHPQPSFR